MILHWWEPDTLLYGLMVAVVSILRMLING
jgi:hypothetical protein